MRSSRCLVWLTRSLFPFAAVYLSARCGVAPSAGETHRLRRKWVLPRPGDWGLQILFSASKTHDVVLLSNTHICPDKFMVEGWVERRRRAGLLVMETPEASKIFEKAAKFIHEYTVRRGRRKMPATLSSPHATSFLPDQRLPYITGETRCNPGALAAEGGAGKCHGY
jgi:hypothetical protein